MVTWVREGFFIKYSISVVVLFHSSSHPFFMGMVMHGNALIISSKQREIKFEPRIKIYVTMKYPLHAYTSIWELHSNNIHVTSSTNTRYQAAFYRGYAEDLRSANLTFCGVPVCD